MKLYCFLLLLFTTYILPAQVPRDRLIEALQLSETHSEAVEDEVAFSVLKQAMDELSGALEKDSLLGLAYHKLGAYANNLGEFDTAVGYYQKAVQIRSQIFPAYHFDVLKSRRNMGDILVERLENIREAKEQYEKIIQQFSFDPGLSDDFKADIYLKQGSTLARMKDFDLAENYILTGIDLAKRYDEFYLLSRSYNIVAVYYGELEDGGKMIEYAKKRLSLYEDLPNEDLYEEDFWDIADCHQNLALGYEYLGNKEKAIGHYKKSIRLNKRDTVERAKYIGEAYNNLADFYFNQNQLEEAFLSIEQAIRYYEKIKVPHALSIAYYNKGEINFEQGKTEEALKDYQKAIQLYTFDFKSDNYLENPPRDVILRGVKSEFVYYLADKAKILRTYARQKQDISILETAVATYDLVAQFIDDVRIEFESDESKAFLSQESKGIYEQALSTCLELYRQTKNEGIHEKAFQYAERSKALILLEAIKESNAKTLSKVDSEILEEEKRFRNAIKKLEQALFEANEAEQADLRQELILKEQKLANTIKRIEKRNPSYYQMKYELALPEVAKIQDQLDKQEGVLEYFVGQENVYWFYIDKTQFLSDVISLDFPLKEWIQAFRAGIYKPFYRNFSHLDRDSLTNIYLERAYQLYEKLLKEVLEKAQAQQKIRIIPDGVLGYIPFDALLTEASEGVNYDNIGKAPFLHRDYQISYSYSMALLEEMSRLRIQPQKQMLAIAPVFQAKDTLMLGQTPVIFNPILQNQEASQNIARLFGGELLVGSSALKAPFLKQASQFRFLHFASHAQVNEENANFSFISFSQLGEQQAKEQLLFVNELYLMELEAEMVVLSACEAGLGTLHEGEGVISLARAFSYAGAKSIITSLWQVSADKSMVLMEHFYQALEDGKSKDEALYLAKQNLILAGDAHPYYWSSFIPIGDMSSIETAGKKWAYYLASGVLALFFLRFFLSRKRRQD